MRNVSQLVSFPAASMTQAELPEDIKAMCISLVTAQDLTEDQIRERRAEILSAMPEQLKKELSFYGAELPTDKIQVGMKAGTLLFDAYIAATKQPEAPLAKHLHKKRVMELAEMLNSEEFEVPEWAVPGIKSVLEDDQAWKRLQPTAWIEVGTNSETGESQKKHFTLTSQGANFFSDVLSAAIQAVGG